MRTPNFFIAGAPNTGTTSLYFYLRQHPQVYMSPVKEPSFFGADAARRRSLRRRFRRLIHRSDEVSSWDDYLKLFRGARDERAIGEATPRYLLLPGAARAIRDRIPDAKLIFVLRDPADWLLTRYLATFWPDARGSFRMRFLAGMRPGNEWSRALTIGRYATHLQRFFDVFSREQLHIELYEDFRRDSLGAVRRILAFLGVDPEYPVDTSYRHNETVVPRFPVLHDLRRRALGDLPLTAWLPGFARHALRRLYKRPRPALVMDPADRVMVIDYYRDEILRTAALIGRDLSAWLR